MNSQFGAARFFCHAVTSHCRGLVRSCVHIAGRAGRAPVARCGRIHRGRPGAVPRRRGCAAPVSRPGSPCAENAAGSPRTAGERDASHRPNCLRGRGYGRVTWLAIPVLEVFASPPSAASFCAENEQGAVENYPLVTTSPRPRRTGARGAGGANRRRLTPAPPVRTNGANASASRSVSLRIN